VRYAARVPTRALPLLALWLVTLGAPAAAQPARPGAGTPDWRGTGVVLKLLPPPSDLHATRPVIVIEHQPIAGLMDESMAMPFFVASTDLFKGLRAGDRITFGLKETSDALLVISIERMAPAR
jgi:Cu/Ag efflux protein CusF